MTTLVRLHWLIALGPNNTSPRGERFALPARFEHQGEDWKDNAWSLVIEVIDHPDADKVQMAAASFLSEDAPVDWLVAGQRFSLNEGNLIVAEGEILAPSN